MRTARWVFGLAALYGFCVLAPGLFIEPLSGAGNVLTQPEFYYGFYGSALVWQGVFLLIASDPIRYRPLIALAILEKLAFAITCLLLWHSGRLGSDSGPFIGAMIDALWSMAFAVAFANAATKSAPH